ncbi:MAG: polymerase sigma factor RpoE [Myxococcaceae bacterium]|nr:polymerase sigma factor RpoE [Myxococcaceae bacterium]
MEVFLKERDLRGHSEAPAASVRNVNAQALEIAEDFALLDECRAGNQAAWRELYEQHFDFVLRSSRHLGTPPAELDDVVQETFLVAYRRLSSFTTGRFTTWLYRIVANLVSSRLRRRRVREALLSLFGRGEADRVARGPDHAYQSREAQGEVSAVLAKMAPKKREVFALYELEGLSGEEIAERVGCKVDTVWTRLHYARADFERLARQRGVIS